MASRQVLRQLVSLSDRWGCGAPRAMEAVAATIEQALAGALLWNETAGMYAPSSGNCAQLTDVWGSALALETGAVRTQYRTTAPYTAHTPHHALHRTQHLPAARWRSRQARDTTLHDSLHVVCGMHAVPHFNFPGMTHHWEVRMTKNTASMNACIDLCRPHQPRDLGPDSRSIAG